jgi:hypothetical protein
MTRDCYQIITDKPALEKFIDWLPDHSKEECYFYALFCRAKYSEDVKKSGGGNLLFRGISDKKSLVRKFQQLECPIGSYEKVGQPIPQEALALYINPNPRNLFSATLNSLCKLAENIKAGHKTASPHKEALSCVQTSAGDKIFLDFDIDFKQPSYVKSALQILKPLIPEIVETRGGYHVLVRRDQISQIQEKMWHKKMSELSDVTGDCLIPVVGGFHGGFTPKFVNPEDFS